ncbi:hypothetical protein HQ865_13725 [Mucilaginibacter mali]|uniref:Pectinesterase catalytic domain-containing protein n=1 Tax=Mucilaginibacter mali TaxID=2740462 RepID=A0A7D4QBU6_9SPHI|nr:pectinesterase family protein [Mucilaginibacter mali]QKJ30764.1 hypothetical protein HQ865_13725 [Mucilaginibacter mali]
MRQITITVLLLITAFTVKAAGYDAVVAKDGSGTYKSVQAAIDAAPEGCTSPYKIYIKKGTYTEQITIPASKPFLELIGENVATTTIAYADGKGGTTAFTINANDCMLTGLTLENTQGRIGDGPQSLAVKTNADRIVFVNCRFISGQDTVMVAPANYRVYFYNCYIDGNTDFIYGASVAVFDKCVIYCRDRTDLSKGGYLTAASTPVNQPYGLVFRDCLLPGNHGITSYTLGRPWQNDASTEVKGRTRAGNKVVFLNTKMGASIQPVGWSMWDAGTKTENIIYAEYHTQNTDGSLLDISKRVDWSKQLNVKDAAIYYDNKAVLGNWEPFAVWADLKQDRKQSSLAVANFKVRFGTIDCFLQFNSCWPQQGVTYTLLKSSDGVNYQEVKQLTSASNTDAAFEFTDQLPAEAQTCYYQVKAAKGKETVLSEAIIVNLKDKPQGKTYTR